MGRIQKKKDPGKKKAQRLNKQETETTQANKGVASGPIKTAPVPKKNAGVAKPKTAREDNVLQKSIQFLREVKIELKKVTWPSRKQTMGSTAVVVILVLIISLFLGVVDFGLSRLLRAVLP